MITTETPAAADVLITPVTEFTVTMKFPSRRAAFKFFYEYRFSSDLDERPIVKAFEDAFCGEE